MDKMIESLSKEIEEMEAQIDNYQGQINQKKIQIAGFVYGYSLGDIVTNGQTVWLVNSYSGKRFKALRRKNSGEWCINEEYIHPEQNLKKTMETLNINHEPEVAAGGN